MDKSIIFVSICIGESRRMKKGLSPQDLELPKECNQIRWIFKTMYLPSNLCRCLVATSLAWWIRSCFALSALSFCSCLQNYYNAQCEHITSHMGPDVTKPVFGVSDKARFKPVSSAKETS